jgi:hypothetical protein
LTTVNDIDPTGSCMPPRRTHVADLELTSACSSFPVSSFSKVLSACHVASLMV